MFIRLKSIDGVTTILNTDFVTRFIIGKTCITSEDTDNLSLEFEKDFHGLMDQLSQGGQIFKAREVENNIPDNLKKFN